MSTVVDEGVSHLKTPSLHASSTFLDGEVERYWDQIPQWREISTKDFNSYSWQVSALQRLKSHPIRANLT